MNIFLKSLAQVPFGIDCMDFLFLILDGRFICCVTHTHVPSVYVCVCLPFRLSFRFAGFVL